MGGEIGAPVGGAIGTGAALAALQPEAVPVLAPAGAIAGGVIGAGYGKAKTLETYDRYAPKIAARAQEITDETRRAADDLIARDRRFPTPLTEAFGQGLAPPRSTAEPRPGQRYR
ncbi:hypothetical protein BH11PSE1_BH11PSE1_25350 [soil metagenome]